LLCRLRIVRQAQVADERHERNGVPQHRHVRLKDCV
jgi:hypothetical protein